MNACILEWVVSKLVNEWFRSVESNCGFTFYHHNFMSWTNIFPCYIVVISCVFYSKHSCMNLVLIKLMHTMQCNNYVAKHIFS